MELNEGVYWLFRAYLGRGEGEVVCEHVVVLRDDAALGFRDFWWQARVRDFLYSRSPTIPLRWYEGFALRFSLQLL